MDKNEINNVIAITIADSLSQILPEKSFRLIRKNKRPAIITPAKAPAEKVIINAVPTTNRGKPFFIPGLRIKADRAMKTGRIKKLPNTCGSVAVPIKRGK
jgi:hypothetical protein